MSEYYLSKSQILQNTLIATNHDKLVSVIIVIVKDLEHTVFLPSMSMSPSVSQWIENGDRNLVAVHVSSRNEYFGWRSVCVYFQIDCFSFNAIRCDKGWETDNETHLKVENYHYIFVNCFYRKWLLFSVRLLKQGFFWKIKFILIVFRVSCRLGNDASFKRNKAPLK